MFLRNFEKTLLVHFAPPGKFLYVLVLFLVLLEKLMMCSYKRIMFSRKFICFLITCKPPGKFDVFEISLKKVAGKHVTRTLKAEIFAFFAFFGLLRKFMPLQISKQQNAKVFSHEIIGNFENAKVFPRKKEIVFRSKFMRGTSLKFVVFRK